MDEHINTFIVLRHYVKYLTVDFSHYVKCLEILVIS